MKSDNIVIVGGGTAGWMTASTLVKLFPKKKITLIESPNIKTIGVGESTIGQINQWLSLIGIDAKDFMKECNATFKFGIRFTDFYRKGSGFYDYPFGKPEYVDINENNLWYFKKIINPSIKVNDYVDSYFPIMAIINNNKIYDGEELGAFNFKKDVAYHFDATKFALWLRDNICLPKVNHIKSEVDKIIHDDNGINSLILNDGQIIEADLFIDCTGFRSMLLGKTMGVDFISYEDIIPNNCAWATHVDYTDKEKQLVTYANCTAIDNGWVWSIPLWNSMGTGYVYSDKYITDDNALEQFKSHLKKEGYNIDGCKFNKVPFKSGVYKKLFVKNVVAIGLSAGFVEPLESNGLVTIHEFLEYLSITLDREYISQWDRDVFSYSCIHTIRNWAEFVAMHYSFSHRDDTEYWRDIQSRVYDESIYDLSPTISNGFRDAIINRIYDNRFPHDSGISCIATGMNWFPMNDKTLKYANKLKEIDYTQYKLSIKTMDERTKIWDMMVEYSPSLYEYLKKEVYNEL